MIKLYHFPGTRSVRVLWLLEELGLPYQLIEVAASDFRQPYSLNTPTGKVPVIEDDGQIISESGAIVEYIVERYGEGKLAPAIGSTARGAYLQWLHFGETGLLPSMSIIFQHTVVKPEGERFAAVAEDARGVLASGLRLLEKGLNGHDYLVGDGFTAADIMVGYALIPIRKMGLLSAEYPLIHAYLDRLLERPAAQKATGG